MSSTTTANIERVAFISLGCPKNLVDSEQMLGTVREAGFTVVSSDDPADAIVVNTCGFLESSKEESLQVIREAIARRDRGEAKRVVVAGCLVQRHRAKILDWVPGIDAMVGVFDRDRVLDAVGGVDRESLPDGDAAPPYWISGNALQAAEARGRDTVGLTVHGKDGQGIGYWEGDDTRVRLTPRHRAYLRISEGCNQRCAFCTIPSIRGKMRSKPLDHIEREARALVADGAFELGLIGQDTTSWGRDIGDDRGLVGVLETIDLVLGESGGGWGRLMYAYPTDFTDEMIDAIARLPNIVKYIDIPLQHMATPVLDLMRRRTTGEQQIELLEKLRERIPGVAIRTTFIVGFPGETDEHFEELRGFVDDFGFDMVGAFQFSPEPGTPAGTLDADPKLHVPDDVKAAREEALMLTQQAVCFDNMNYLVEEAVQFDVLIDGRSDDEGVALGRAYFQAPEVDSVVRVKSINPLVPGELVRCTVVEADGYDLVAVPTADLDTSISLPVVG